MKEGVTAAIEAPGLMRSYPGWRVVFAAWVGEAMSAYPVIGFTFSIFLAQVIGDYGWSRETASAYSVYLLTSAVALPLWGVAVDRFGARRAITVAVLVCAIALGSFKWLSTQLHWYVGYIILGLASGGISTIPYFRVISCWFDRRRGLALGIVMAGGGVSAIAMPALAQYLIETVGWQSAFVWIAALILLVTLPIVWLGLTETPADAGVRLESWGETAPLTMGRVRGGSGFTARQAMRTKDFWLMTIAMALASLAVMCALAYLVPLLQDRGFTVRHAALAMSVVGAGSLAGRLVTGWLLDHLYASYVACLLFGLGGIGLISMSFVVPDGLPLAFLCAFLIGMALGGEGDIMAYMVTRYFGVASFGQIYGYAYLGFIVGGAAGPALLSVLVASFSNIQQYILVPFGLMMVAAIVIILRMSDYRICTEEKTHA